jgi:peptidoglycan/LPS O-acetylase OafA/YrhL
MKPLQSVAMGLVIVALSARVHGYDLLADPAGWLLVLLGLRGLPVPGPEGRRLLALAALAGVVSVAVWPPAATDAIYDADASLAWAVNLPQLLFSALLCHVLARRAGEADDPRASRWLTLTRTAVVVVALLPVLVFGAGMSSLEVPSYLAAALVALLLVVLLFAYASRPWATSGLDHAGTVTPPGS